MTDARRGGRNWRTRDPALSVLAWAPGRNPYFRNVYSGLGEERVRVVEHSVLRCLFGRYDVWHVQFPDRAAVGGRIAAPARAVAFALMVLRCRLFRRPIIWTIHNLHPHERLHPRLEQAVFSFFAARVDYVISLSETGQRLAQQTWPALARTPGGIIPHPHYRDAYPNTVCRGQARAALGLPEASRVVLLVGKMRGYKDPVSTVATFRRLTDPDARLIVAGEASSDALRREIEKAARGDQRVVLHLREFPDGEAQIYLNAADLVALPYLDILNSGSAIFALSFNRPVLLPDRGAMKELARIVGPDWVRLFSGELEAGELERALVWACATGRPQQPSLDSLSPAQAVRAHAEAFRAVAGRRR